MCAATAFIAADSPPPYANHSASLISDRLGNNQYIRLDIGSFWMGFLLDQFNCPAFRWYLAIRDVWQIWERTMRMKSFLVFFSYHAIDIVGGKSTWVRIDTEKDESNHCWSSSGLAQILLHKSASHVGRKNHLMKKWVYRWSYSLLIESPLLWRVPKLSRKQLQFIECVDDTHHLFLMWWSSDEQLKIVLSVRYLSDE